MKFWTGVGFGLGLGAGLGFWLSSVLEKQEERITKEQKERYGLNQNDRDYLEEKLEELRK